MPRPLANSSALFESQLLSPQSILTANKNLHFTSSLNTQHVVTTIQTFLLFSHSTRQETDLSPCKGHIYKNRVHFIRMQERDKTHHNIYNVLISISFISQRFEYEYEYEY